MNKLYRLWLETAEAYASEVAVSGPGAHGRSWTFADLKREAEELQVGESGSLKFANWEIGGDVEFLLQTLAAWKEDRVLCPCEGEQGREPQIPEIPNESLEEKRVAHIKLTSGSSGSPKVVLFTADQLVADCTNIVNTMGLNRQSPNIGAISLAHSYGFSNLVLPLFLHGIPILLAGSPLPNPVHTALREAGGNATLPAVPAMWQAWSSVGILTDASFRMGISAGAVMPIILEKQIYENYGKKIHNFLGSSECGGIAFDRSDAPREDPSDIGEPMEGVSVETTDSGRLAVVSDAVGLCYWPESSEPTDLGNGRFVIGDFGAVIDGRVRLTGRSGDVINVAGRKLAPEEVEQVLAADASVQHCVVFGIPSEDSSRGDEVVACLCPNEGFDLDEFRKRAIKALRSWQVPRRWWVEPELAPDVRGKLSRALWRERFLTSSAMSN